MMTELQKCRLAAIRVFKGVFDRLMDKSHNKKCSLEDREAYLNNAKGIVKAIIELGELNDFEFSEMISKVEEENDEKYETC